MNAQASLFDYDAYHMAAALYPEGARFHSEHPEAVDAIVAWAQDDVAAGSKSVSMQCYIERLRNPRTRPDNVILQLDDGSYLVNHNLRRPLTDYVMTLYPELPFRTRHCGGDKCVPNSTRKPVRGAAA